MRRTVDALRKGLSCANCVGIDCSWPAGRLLCGTFWTAWPGRTGLSDAAVVRTAACALPCSTALRHAAAAQHVHELHELRRHSPLRYELGSGSMIDWDKIVLTVEVSAAMGAVIGLVQGLGDVFSRRRQGERAASGQIRLELRGQDAAHGRKWVDGALDEPVDQRLIAQHPAGQSPCRQ